MTLKCTNASMHNNSPFWRGPHVMGVVNVTPDSFSDGGQFFKADRAVEHGLELLDEGASILDVGGESSRPGAEVVEIEEEIARVVPVIEGLAGHAKWISVDTRNAKTMRAAIEAGANIVNDISGLTHDIESVKVVAEAGVHVFVMHMQGTPQTMQEKPQYNNVVDEIFEYLKERIAFCEANRIEKEKIVCDPGIGFGKTVQDNLLILRNISKFQDLGVPILLGTSRKSFIGKISGGEPENERLGGSLSSALYGISKGVQIVRVHDVRQHVQAFKIYNAILSEKATS